jgi:hypothetical protein
MGSLTPEAVLETVHLVALTGSSARLRGERLKTMDQQKRPITVFGNLVPGNEVRSFQIPVEATPKPMIAS